MEIYLEAVHKYQHLHECTNYTLSGVEEGGGGYGS